jgi:ABC-type Fe3+/spermidine/putrescine transport system ATPase subunit
MADIRLEGVSKAYGERLAVHELELELADGEYLSVVGPSGCGKTTLLRLIAGFLEPSAGRILIGGAVAADAAKGTFVPAEERDLGMVFQSFAVWPHMSVFDNVAYPLRLRHQSRSAIAAATHGMLDTLGLGDFGERRPSTLSGGQLQRVALARALISHPRALLLDEPLSSLDAQLRERLGQEIRSLQRDTGVTVVHVTHDQAEALAWSDRIAIMSEQGRLVRLGTPREVYSQPETEYSARLLGRATVLPGRLVSELQAMVQDPNNPARLVGPIPTTGRSGGLAPERDMKLAFRPEHWEPCGPDEPEAIHWTVEALLYRGKSCDVALRAGQASASVDVPLAEGLAPGSRISLRPRCCMVLSG